jgi:hydroxymethylglutaryl-CoA reductase (NADPH)
MENNFIETYLPIAKNLMGNADEFFLEHGTAVIISSILFGLFAFVTSSVTNNNKKSDDLKSKIKPQPKWGVLRFCNYIVLAIFIGSITFATLNYKKVLMQPVGSASPLTHMFFPCMVLWTCCLAYFFGFFGISLIDTDEISESPSSFGLEDAQRQAKNAEKSIKQKEVIPVSRNDTPICAEGKQPIVNSEELNYETMSDDEVLGYLLAGNLKDYQLEKKLGDYERAVKLRRGLYENILDNKLDLIPYSGYDYNKVFGANCEIVVGYVPIPVGIVGPITMNKEPIYIPMATTEGCLVASTNRGCKAISVSGGCNAILLKDGITRAPCIRMPSAVRAAAVKHWVANKDNYALLATAFNSTTGYGKLESCEATVAGRNVYLRFCCMSGDAMGMNMVSKGCLKAIETLEVEFPDLILIAISGNMCTDKKPSAINWILGRGKSVVIEATIPEKIVTSVLKSSVHDMIETNKHKNHIGSAMAGSIGGFNAHAANVVTAVFLATGQDPAQNVESSNCLTIMEYADDRKSLYVSVTMPSIEVGTVGGGTHLPAQAGCLEICKVRGAAKGENAMPGDNARQLALIVGSAVLAGELSLMAALAANHLVQSHMQHNRKPQAVVSEAPAKAIVSNMRKTASMPIIHDPK